MTDAYSVVEKNKSDPPDSAMISFILLVNAMFFSALLFGDKTLFFRDILVFSYPMKYQLYRAYHGQFLPFWDPQILSGTPFMANLQSCVFYPPSLLFFLNDFNTAFNLHFVLHSLLLVLSVYALTRYWGLSTLAGTCSALTALFGGYFLSLSSTLNHYQSAAWLPLVFLLFQRYVAEGGPGLWLAAIFSWTCQILGGSPEVCVMTALLIYSYVMAFEQQEKGAVSRLKRIVSLSVLFALGVGLAALQLLPTYLLIGESVRSGGLDFNAHAEWSLSTSALVEMVLPESKIGFMDSLDSFHISFILSNYMGLAAAMGLLLAKTKEARYWLLIFFIGVFLALGKNNFLYIFLYRWFPGMGLFRYPEKYLLISAFSMCFLTGYGYKALFEGHGKDSRTRLSVAVLCLIATMLALAITYPQRRVFLIEGFSWLAAIFLLHRYHCCGKLGNTAKYLFVLLIMVDLLPKNYPLVPMISKLFYTEAPSGDTAARDSRIYSGSLAGNTEKNTFPAQATLLLRHLAVKDVLHPNYGVVHGYSYADGLVGMETSDAWLWQEIFSKSSPERRQRMLERANVKYLVDENEGKIKTLSAVLPRAFLVSAGQLQKDPQLLNIYYDENFDPLKSVLLSEPVSLTAADDFEGKIAYAHYEANKVTIHSEQNRQGFLVLLDSWFPGWTSTVDGSTEPIYRANHFYRAVKLEPGVHTIEFSYAAPGFRAGMHISEATICIMALIVIIRRKKKEAR